jgi:glycosyltransferase involved in cell wall biosynthesis
VLGRSFYGLHGFGGLERHLFDLVRHHLAEGWEVTVLTRPPAAWPAVDPSRWQVVAGQPRCRVRFIDYRTFPLAGRAGTTILDRSTAYPWFGWRAGRAAARLAAAGEVDVVYGVGASVWGYARARTAGAPAPLVFNPQGLEEFGGFDGTYGGHALKAPAYAPLRAVVRDCARRSDAVIATDRAIVPTVRKHLPVDASKVHLIPNGLDVVDLDRLVNADAGGAARAAAGIGAHEILLVSVGRLEESKGFADLARALAQVGGDTGWRWVLVGDGPERRSLRALADDLGIAGRVHFAGRATDEDLHAWYDAADLFVHPTRYEGSSLVTLEAMLHRRAVLATRAGGLPDKVLPGHTGWLADPSSPAALASALRQAFAERERWAAYGEAGRRLLEEQFDWRVLQGRFSALYRSLAEAR